MQFAMALVWQDEKLELVLRHWRFLGIALPMWICPRSNSYETVRDGRFNFHVEISHPLTGLIVRYQGWLEPKPALDTTASPASVQAVEAPGEARKDFVSRFVEMQQARPTSVRHAMTRPATEDTTMQYMLLIHMDETAMPNITPEMAFEMNSAYMAYNDALQKANAWVTGERLKPSPNSTVVKVRNDKTEVLDGPYRRHQGAARRLLYDRGARSRCGARLGGRCPGASNGTIEVRPVWTSH